MTGSETRRFGMHAHLLLDVIQKQAGTIEKAILEGVMNGVDAGASRIDVTLTGERLIIVDDGRGFESRETIETFFETFGTPHQEGDATYGRFRMGRGQLFAFGANRWRTNVFEMDVDVKANGLDYDLRTVAEPVPGCRIEVDLYQPLLPSERDSAEREIRSWVAWVSIPVVINGKLASADPALGKWDVETDDAWFKLTATRSTLSVYNLGVLVMNAPAHRFGVGGVVVSKQRLDVNFARNDVMATCPAFNAIRKELRRHSDKETAGKKRLTDTERQHVAHRIVSDDIAWADGSSSPVLTDVEGRSFGIETLSSKLSRSSLRTIVCAPRGDRIAIRVQNSGMAIALSDETIERFGVADGAALLQALTSFCANAADRPGAQRAWIAHHAAKVLGETVAVDVSAFADAIDSSYETVDPKTMRRHQRKLIDVIHRGAYRVAAGMGKTPRRVVAGRSEIAQAWTDGSKTIWIELGRLPLLSQGFKGCVRLASLLVHEYLHDVADQGSHQHDEEFLQRMHDIALDDDVIGETAILMMRAMAEHARREGAKPTTTVSIFEDLEERIVRAGGSADTSAPPAPADEAPTAIAA